MASLHSQSSQNGHNMQLPSHGNIRHLRSTRHLVLTVNLLFIVLSFDAWHGNPVKMTKAKAFKAVSHSPRACVRRTPLEQLQQRSISQTTKKEIQHSRQKEVLHSSNDDSNSSHRDETSINFAKSPKLLLPIVAVVSLTITTIAAFAQLLPGPLIDATSPPPFFATLPHGIILSGSFDPYSTSLIFRDLSSTLFSIVAATLFVKACTYPVKIGKLEPRDSRKIIHTLSAPLFILVWPLFSNAYGARVFASIVPLLNAVRLFVAGTGPGVLEENAGIVADSNGYVGSESELANAISRSGDAKEALQGPFVYVLVLLVSTFFFWTDTPIGVVAISAMAIGDGLADLVGRRFGSSNKWFFNKNKSIAGSAAFVAGSFLGSYGLLSWLVATGTMDPLALEPPVLLLRLLVIATICAAVELIPIGDDNWSVPISAAAMATYLLN